LILLSSRLGIDLKTRRVSVNTGKSRIESPLIWQACCVRLQTPQSSARSQSIHSSAAVAHFCFASATNHRTRNAGLIKCRRAEIVSAFALV
jgi:hypothetical protein